MKQRTPRTLTVASLVVAFALTGAACSQSTSVDTAAEVKTEGVTASTIDHQGATPPTGVDGIEVGDRLDDVGASTDEPSNPVLPGFEAVEWGDLVPAGFSDNEILSRYEDRLLEAEPGSPELDAIYEEMNAEFDNAEVNAELDGTPIQLAGFVAPLTYEEDRVTEFLLVPYFGACIHVPPPPANQTIMISLPDGESLTVEESWGAVWVAGTLSTGTTDTDLATAGYTISGPQFGVYNT